MAVFDGVIPAIVGAAGAGAAAGYEITRSLRFNSADSAYLNRTPSSAGNQKKFTWSGWIKRTEFGGNKTFFSSATSNTSNPRTDWQFYDDTLYITFNPSGSSWLTVQTIRKFRDPSAWYHIVVAVDTTQGTNTDRVKIYVNGVRDTNLQNYSTFTQNSDLHINSTTQHSIGRYEAGDSNYFPGYLADIHFIDGQALAPTDFGGYDDNNVWQPKEVSVSSINDGTVWSNGGDNTNAETNQEWDKAFDGVIGRTADGAVSNTNTTMTWSGTIPANGKRVRVNYASGTSMSGGQIVVNSTNVNPSAGETSGTWVDLGVFSADITSMSCSRGTVLDSGALSFCAIEVGGEILIDSYNNSTGYGTNGFHLDFSDNSSNAALGTDSSGNSNTWTVNNLSVASGVGNDSLIDTPTNYDDGTNVGGNYATLNPLTGSTLTNGNLNITGTNQGHSTIRAKSGKWYAEYTCVTVAASNWAYVGIAFDNVNTGSNWRLYRSSNGDYYNGSSYSSYGSSWTAGDVVGVAVDIDNNTLTFYKNGVSQGQITGLGISGKDVGFISVPTGSGGGELAVNFGQRPFAISSVPTGYKSLCTQNLPDPTIADGSDYFDTKLWTGNGSTQSITGFEFSPDFVWVKSRNFATDHALFDIVRGATKRLRSNQANAENTDANTLTAFNSDGFSLGSSSAVNFNNNTFVGWSWDAGSSTVSNTDGSITSNVRANASAGFSIVSYTADATSSQTIGHGLNVKPGLIIVKDRDAAINWSVYHQSLDITAGEYLKLNTTEANLVSNSQYNSTEATTSVFTVGSGGNTNFQTGNEYIAYCFAPVEGYSAFGSYTGNGSADGPFVFTGMRPRWIMVKRYDGLAPWVIVDTERNTFNVMDNHLLANDSAAENGSTIGNICDSVSNGFKFRGSDGWFNGSSANYIYAAFGDPFKTARAR